MSLHHGEVKYTLQVTPELIVGGTVYVILSSPSTPLNRHSLPTPSPIYSKYPGNDQPPSHPR
ncbi:hypothetical protein E2C01_079782 [Portunus trituberculatus]|uniref:Uncharacterized protein n=1 Tax=Portunus trituberculatus TaxID=210409 RepID=A0A5B7IXW7_PORTR|nr:hypothetical protein [Portunus trituberculatus]